jgi:hypothetical protein
MHYPEQILVIVGGRIVPSPPFSGVLFRRRIVETIRVVDSNEFWGVVGEWR